MNGALIIIRNILYIILFNLFFLILPFIIKPATPDVTKPYQIWFNILFLLFISLPRGK
jgi:hypothetical protein